MKKLIKHQKGFYENLLDKNLSIVPIKEFKNPKGEIGHKPSISSFKAIREKVYTNIEFENIYENPLNVSFGLLTGFNDVEAIDVDSKIIKNKADRDSFLKEYFNLLDSHIDNFYEKVCVVKSQSGGFHILYKSKSLVGPIKIARPKGYKEALIESRGKGGFVYIYKQVKGLQYHEIDYISDEDRDMIWQISKTYHYEEPIQPKVQTRKTISQDGLTPWADFANKNNVLDICSDDFDIIRHGRNSILVRRKGSDAAHSGYLFDNSGKLYLFSTGTIYPHEKPLNSFDVYVYKHHKGDYSAATKQAYSDGYGDRYVVNTEIEIDQVVIENNDFPLNVFPDFFVNYINECSNKLNASVDFMGVALLWMISTLVGNTFKVKVKNGWIDSPIVWISVIGDAGVGKTPDLKMILKPLMDLNATEIKRYSKRYKEFQAYEKMSKEDKDVNATLEEPVKNQLVVDDITMESLVDMHSKNPKSIGVFKDELAGWFKDMNKYREGSDKERYLSAWSGDSIVLNRKTAEDAFVQNPFIPILGGIQPSIFKEFQTSENQSNGFMDRMLFCDPHKVASYPTDNELDEELINDYRDIIFKIKEHIDQSFTVINEEIIEPFILELSKDAKKEYKKAHCELIDLMNSDNEIHYYKGMYAKQITYIPRFALLIEFLDNIILNKAPKQISKESILKAIKLSKYFINMAKINKSDNIIQSKIKTVYESLKTKPNKTIALELTKLFPDISKTKIAEVMDVSKRTLYRYLK